MAVYAELHCHSAYSFLDGVSLPEELACAALELGYETLALTDHNSLAGAMEFAHCAHGLGLRAIHGAELDLDDGRHVLVLVADARGWSNLCRLLTLAHAHTRDPVPHPPPAAVSLATLCEHAEGLVCLTGCATCGVHDEPSVRRLREAFGPERLRVELQRPFLRDDRARNRALEALAGRLGLRCVASGNVHAHDRRRAELQDAFVALRHHSTLEASEPLRRSNHSHVMASPQAMAHRFADHPEAVAESVRLARELSAFDLTHDLGYRYPGAEDDSAQRRLSELCHARLAERYGRGTSVAHRREARSRLEQELALIDRLGLPGFFLLHHDMLELAREVAVEVRGTDAARALLPPGRGRGSSVSSIVCFLTGLSHIDPIANRLMLGRFLNEEIKSLPDIDLDFPRDIREVLIPRVHDRYGRDRAALVATFPSYRSRGAIRELGKALGLAPGDIERVARGSEGFVHADSPGMEGRDSSDGVGGDIAAALGRERLEGEPPSRWRWLARLATEAQGLPRHISQHPGGMIVATRPLIDCCPLVPAAMEGRQLVQWDKDSCADAGFLKIDLLGLGMLSAVERCVELIARHRNERIDLSRIPFDDPATFKAIQEADTVGVFQIESRAQMQSLKRTRPETLDDLTIQVAIIRPGPIQGGAVNPYIERRQRVREDPSYEPEALHPTLETVLRETLGTIIFQDQVMEVAQAFAGLSPGEADGLRRAMSRKRSAAALERFRRRFLEGARVHARADAATAEQVWQMIVGFAGFGFPKAHSAAFGLLAYQSTWLRVHHPTEFLCALLNEQPMGFYAPDTLVHEAGRRGVRLLGLDVNASMAECTVEDGAVRIGLGYVNGVARADVEALVDAREREGRFASIAELASRSGCGRATLEQLAWSGACDGLLPEGQRGDRRVALWHLGVATPGRAVPGGTQLSLPLELPGAPPLRELDRWQRLIADYATSGITLSDHVMAALRGRLPAGTATSADLETLPHASRVSVAGLVIARQRPATARGVVFLLFEDEWGAINLIVPPALYERQRHLVRAEPLLIADGRLERPPKGGGVINVLVSELRALEVSLNPAQAQPPPAQVHELPAPAGEEDEGENVAASMRAVAPAIMSFASGRRR